MCTYRCVHKAHAGSGRRFFRKVDAQLETIDNSVHDHGRLKAVTTAATRSRSGSLQPAGPSSVAALFDATYVDRERAVVPSQAHRARGAKALHRIGSKDLATAWHAGVAQWQSRSFPSSKDPRISAIFLVKCSSKGGLVFKDLRNSCKTIEGRWAWP